MKFTNLVIAVSAVVIEIVIIWFYRKRDRLPIKNNTLFIKMIETAFIVTVLNVITIILGYVEPTKQMIALHYGVNVVYIGLYESSFVFIFEYVLWNAGNHNKWMKTIWFNLVPTIVAVGTIIWILTTNEVFYIDQTNTFHFGKYFYYANVFPFVSMLYALIAFVIKKYDDFTQRDLGIAFSVALMIAGVFSDNIVQDLIPMDYFIAFSFMVLYISAENPEYYISEKFRCFNYLGFERYINEIIVEGQKRYVYGIEIRNLDTIRSRCNTETVYTSMQCLVKHIQNDFPKMHVFYTDNRCFNLVVKKPLDRRMFQNYVNALMKVSFQGSLGDVYFWTRPIIIANSEHCKNASYVINGELYAIRHDYPNNAVLEVDQHVYKQVDKERRILEMLEYALMNDGIQAYIQPIYSTKKKRIIGCESLARMVDPECGLIMPNDFIPLAENSGLIVKLGYRIFEKTCQFIMSSHVLDEGIEFVNVNCSPIQFQDINLAYKFKEISDGYGLDFSIFRFEITESSIEHSELMKTQAENFKGYHASVVIDDFGKGESNLSRVKDIDFDVAKLDMSVVWDYFSGKDSFMLDMITVLKKQQLQIVAEGVETIEMVDALGDMDIEYLQGYYFSKPLPEELFTKYVKEFNEKKDMECK